MLTEAAKASAPRGFLEHCETLRAITTGRSARVPPRLLADSRPYVWRKRTAPHAHPRAISASTGVVQIQARRRPGSLPPGWPGECEVRTRQYVYFGPSKMVKSTELFGWPKAATLTVLAPWNKADEISIFLVSPSER